MNTVMDAKKSIAKRLVSASEEAVAQTWLSLENAFPGMLPSLQPATVAVKPRQPLKRRENRFPKP